MALLQELNNYVQTNLLDFNSISDDRKKLLHELTTYVQLKKQSGARLNFICTHNSRRSHISQLWAQAAAEYYNIANVHCYSGGTEATAFNPRAVNAMRHAGFAISQQTEGNNPVYHVQISDTKSLLAFSKTYDAPENPTSDFCAVMTCSHADENCPLIPGVEKRIALTYDDPKEFDGTPLEEAKYAERVKEIGTELFYAFSLV
jgi:arsenate reductase (thioredoxin)